MNSPRRYAIRTALCLAALLTLAQIAAAKPWWMRGVESNGNDFLAPDVAFRVSAWADADNMHLRWVIAEGYYLYRHRIEVQAESPDLIVSAPVLPRGQMRADPYFGTQEVYFQQLEASAAYSRSDAGAHPLQIKVIYQGCALAGLCYPPITKVIFPSNPPPIAEPPRHAWEGVAILGGGAAFLLAGWLLRKGRELEIPRL